MIEGDAEVHGTAIGFLVWGGSYQKLFFHAKGAKRQEETAILASGERCSAFRCKNCGGLFVQQPPWVPGYK